MLQAGRTDNGPRLDCRSMMANPFIHHMALSATLLAAGACATSRHPVAVHAETDLACTGAQSQTRDRLEALSIRDERTHPQRLRAYLAAVDHMLVSCDAEARSMSVTLADDWRIQSVFVRNDLARLESASHAALAEMLPSHRRRIDRLIATFAAMDGNPPQNR